MKKYVCDICGREIFKKNRIGGYTVCPKHMHQWFEHRRFLDNNPRTQNDLNEYRLREDGTVEFDCYDANSKVVGQFIIDREDLSKVRYHKWRIDTCNHVVTGNCTKTKPRKELSWLVMDMPTDSELVIDHINGNPLDNRRLNLRICTQGENSCNKHFMSNNTSSAIGVCWDKARRRWAPEICKDYQRWHLGRYKSFDEAAFVRDYAETILFGEFKPANVRNFSSISEERKEALRTYVDKKLGNQLC